MKNLIDRFSDHLAAEEKSPETLAHYQEELLRFESWLGEHYQLSLDEKQVANVTGIMLSEYYQELHTRGLSVPTRNNYVVILHRFFDFLTRLRCRRRPILSENRRANLSVVPDKVVATAAVV